MNGSQAMKKLEFQKLDFNETQNNLSQTERLNSSGHENSRSFSRRSQQDRRNGPRSIDNKIQKILKRGLFVIKNDGPDNQASNITPLKNIDL